MLERNCSLLLTLMNLAFLDKGDLQKLSISLPKTRIEVQVFPYSKALYKEIEFGYVTNFQSAHHEPAAAVSRWQYHQGNPVIASL